MVLPQYCFVWITACFLLAYRDLPAFPVEISWVATANAESRFAFVAGALLVGPIAVYDGVSYLILVPWCFLVGVTLTEHTTIKWAHMLCVNFMVASTLFVISMQRDTWQEGVERVLCYLAFYVARVLAKIGLFALVGYRLPLYAYVFQPIASFRWYVDQMQKAHYDQESKTLGTKVVVRAGAVSQWASFALLGAMLCDVV